MIHIHNQITSIHYLSHVIIFFSYSFPNRFLFCSTFPAFIVSHIVNCFENQEVISWKLVIHATSLTVSSYIMSCIARHFHGIVIILSLYVVIGPSCLFTTFGLNQTISIISCMALSFHLIYLIVFDHTIYFSISM